MTDKEKLNAIRAEVEEYIKAAHKAHTNITEGNLAHLLSFIDSLQEESVSEDLEEACEQLAENARKHKAETSSPFFSQTDYKQGVIDGAQWQKEHLWNDIEYTRTDAFIEKACEWLRNNSHNYANNALGIEYLINDFKDYMKGE